MAHQSSLTILSVSARRLRLRAGLCAQVAGLRAKVLEAGQAAAAHGQEKARLEAREAHLAQVLAAPLPKPLLRQPFQILEGWTTGKLIHHQSVTGSIIIEDE